MATTETETGTVEIPARVQEAIAARTEGATRSVTLEVGNHALTISKTQTHTVNLSLLTDAQILECVTFGAQRFLQNALIAPRKKLEDGAKIPPALADEFWGRWQVGELGDKPRNKTGMTTKQREVLTEWLKAEDPKAKVDTKSIATTWSELDQDVRDAVIAEAQDREDRAAKSIAKLKGKLSINLPAKEGDTEDGGEAKEGDE